MCSCRSTVAVSCEREEGKTDRDKVRETDREIDRDKAHTCRRGWEVDKLRGFVVEVGGNALVLVA